MSEKKPKLPVLSADSTWEETIQGVTIKLREAKLRERVQAASEAASNSPAAPGIEEAARLLSIVCERKNSEGTYEPLAYAELMERGERFFGRLQGAYALGLVALEEQNRNLSGNSKNETSQTEQSASLVRP